MIYQRRFYKSSLIPVKSVKSFSRGLLNFSAQIWKFTGNISFNFFVTDCIFHVINCSNSLEIRVCTNRKISGYRCNGISSRQEITMFAKKRTAYLLFCAAYIGALVVEKPVYTGETVLDCFSYLATIFTHLFLFGLLILANSSFLIPNLLEKKFFGAYAIALIGLIVLYATSMNHYNSFIHETIVT